MTTYNMYWIDKADPKETVLIIIDSLSEARAYADDINSSSNSKFIAVIVDEDGNRYD